MALLIDDRTTIDIEPGGALSFACLLYLADRHETARFAASADSPSVAHCNPFLHKLQHSELRDAQHWHKQALLLRHLDQDSLAHTAWSPTTTDRAPTHWLRAPSPTRRRRRHGGHGRFHSVMAGPRLRGSAPTGNTGFVLIRAER